MKNLLAAALLALTTSVLAAPSQFSDAEVSVELLSDLPAVRRGNMVTFAAQSTFKVAADTSLPAGTKMTMIWTVDCRKKQQRLVLAGLAVPGKQPFMVSQEEMVAIAKKEPFVSPKDNVSKQIMATVCAD